MALSQSALPEVLDAITRADVADRVRQSAATIYQALIEAELTSVIGAEPHERTPDRTAQRSLKARGLHGVQLVISDAHEGLKGAIGAVFTGAAWQRCRVHFLRNVLTRIPKGNAEMVAAAIRTIFAQPDAEHVTSQLDVIATMLGRQLPVVETMLREAVDDVLAFTTFPPAHWKKIWSTNPLERVNKEIKRRTDVVGVFPNSEALLRLAGAVLIETHAEWAVTDRRYLAENTMKQLTAPPQEVAHPAALTA